MRFILEGNSVLQNDHPHQLTFLNAQQWEWSIAGNPSRPFSRRGWYAPMYTGARWDGCAVCNPRSVERTSSGFSRTSNCLLYPSVFHEQCCSVWCNLMIHNDSWNTFWKTINIILICLLSIWIRSHLNFLPQPFKHDDRKLRIRCGRGREILGAFRVSSTKIWTSGLLPQLN